MDAEAEVNIKDIEAERSARRKAIGSLIGMLLGVFRIKHIGTLLLVAQIEAEDTERDIEARILHYKHCETGREIQLGLHECGVRALGCAVIHAPEVAVA